MDAPNPNQPLYYMEIANNVGCPMRSPLLFVEEYDYWKMRMQRFLK